jgi:hypothetical protein
MFSNFDINNYRINRMKNQYKYLNEERDTKNNLKKSMLNYQMLVSVLNIL